MNRISKGRRESLHSEKCSARGSLSQELGGGDCDSPHAPIGLVCINLRTAEPAIIQCIIASGLDISNRRSRGPHNSGKSSRESAVDDLRNAQRMTVTPRRKSLFDCNEWLLFISRLSPIEWSKVAVMEQYHASFSCCGCCSCEEDKAALSYGFISAKINSLNGETNCIISLIEIDLQFIETISYTEGSSTVAWFKASDETNGKENTKAVWINPPHSVMLECDASSCRHRFSLCAEECLFEGESFNSGAVKTVVHPVPRIVCSTTFSEGEMSWNCGLEAWTHQSTVLTHDKDFDVCDKKTVLMCMAV